MRHLNIQKDISTEDWQPWSRYFPGAPENDGNYGGWVKVLRSPEESGKGWTFLFKWVGWPGLKVRHVARVPEDSSEEVVMLDGDFSAGNKTSESGAYIYRGPGAPHAADFGADFVAILHYDGEPDIIDRYEFLDRD